MVIPGTTLLCLATHSTRCKIIDHLIAIRYGSSQHHSTSSFLKYCTFFSKCIHTYIRPAKGFVVSECSEAINAAAENKKKKKYFRDQVTEPFKNNEEADFRPQNTKTRKKKLPNNSRERKTSWKEQLKERKDTTTTTTQGWLRCAQLMTQRSVQVLGGIVENDPSRISPPTGHASRRQRVTMTAAAGEQSLLLSFFTWPLSRSLRTCT